MAIITDSADIQDTRLLVSPSLTAAVISDAQIQRDIYLGRAEAEVLSRLGVDEAGFNALPAATQMKGKIAIKHLAASYMLRSIRDIVSQESLDEVIKYETYSVSTKIKDYETAADDVVPPLTPSTGTIKIIGGKI